MEVVCCGPGRRRSRFAEELGAVPLGIGKIFDDDSHFEKAPAVADAEIENRITGEFFRANRCGLAWIGTAAVRFDRIQLSAAGSKYWTAAPGSVADRLTGRKVKPVWESRSLRVEVRTTWPFSAFCTAAEACSTAGPPIA